MAAVAAAGSRRSASAARGASVVASGGASRRSSRPRRAAARAIDFPFGGGKDGKDGGAKKTARRSGDAGGGEGNLFEQITEGMKASLEGAAEVERVLATRRVNRETEYLIKWMDGGEDTWEPAANVSEDVRREFEGKWWDACREGDEDAVLQMLAEEQRNPRKRDKDGRTGLHYVCGRGKARAINGLINYGARINAQDADGYTPLHIAAGYQYVETVAQLLEAGADPDLEDGSGRTPLQLIQYLKDAQPQDMTGLANRMSLVEIERSMNRYMWEDVPVTSVVDERMDGERVLYQVEWADGGEMQWLPADQLHPGLIEDFEAGLESAEFEAIVDARENVDGAEYLVKWADGETSWEPAGNLDEEDIAEFLAKAEGADAEGAEGAEEAEEAGAEGEGAKAEGEAASAEAVASK